MKNRKVSKITAKTLSIILALTILLSTFPSLALAAGAGNSKYINTRRLATNLDYVNTVYWNDLYNREESYTLLSRPGGDVYPIVMKDDTVYGAVTINEAIAYARTQGLNVIAGMNAGFFTSNGIPLGLFIENGEYKSSPSGWPAVIFDESGAMQILEAPEITMTLTNNGDGAENLNAGKTVSVKNLNKLRNEFGGMYIFTPAFSTVSTRTASKGWFVRFEILEGALTVAGEMKLRVIETFESEGAPIIGENNLLLSAYGAPNEQFNSFTVGDEVTLTTTNNNENLAAAKYATGSGDVLIRDGAITDSTAWDKALLDRHPRTAIGVRADGTVVSFVLDGRNSNYGNGLPMQALAEEMLAMGCVSAVNLDGGGSSIMNVQRPGSADPVTVNRPSDGGARKSSICILFVTNNVSDGAVRNLALSNDGTIVLAGTSFHLEYAATDSAYRPVGAPADISVSDSTLGSVNGNVYTAGVVGGTDTISLLSPSTGATGVGEVFVLNNPTSITAYNDAYKSLPQISLAPKGMVSLMPVATYYRKAVIAQPTSFTYKVVGDIGTITPDGIFYATEKGNSSGSIIISAGTTSITVPVTIQGFSDTVNHWAKEFIDELYVNGIVNGVTATEYAPENKITRGDFVLMLYRAVGKPAVTGTLDAFTDVPVDAYYAEAVVWAKESGITTGVGDNKFEPLSDLTREQAFTFVDRTRGMLKIEHNLGAITGAGAYQSLMHFTDVDLISDYALIPTSVLSALGIIGGSDGKINPQDPLTRAEMAKILCVTLRLNGLPPETITPEETPPPEETAPPEETPPEETPSEETPDPTPEPTDPENDQT